MLVATRDELASIPAHYLVRSPPPPHVYACVRAYQSVGLTTFSRLPIGQSDYDTFSAFTALGTLAVDLGLTVLVQPLEHIVQIWVVLNDLRRGSMQTREAWRRRVEWGVASNKWTDNTLGESRSIRGPILSPTAGLVVTPHHYYTDTAAAAANIHTKTSSPSCSRKNSEISRAISLKPRSTM